MDSPITLDPNLCIGLILLVSGWLAIDLAIKILGLCLGGAGAMLALDLLTLTIPDFRPELWMIVLAGIVGMAIGYFLVQKIFRLLLFIVGFLTSVVTVVRMDEAFNFCERISGGWWGNFPESQWFPVVAGLVGGVVLMFLEKHLLIVLTAVAGATIIVQGNSLQEKWLTITLVGVAIQFLLYRFITKRKKA
ncbi:MAG: hypothetical protein H6752_15790 [Candidatus Omnitrophica bacterium]|nr:hypothetical protein [Candidatus Omnitrophota bacterium]MCB9769657.1 hypothetical protein [Candidatus Omnitrophota bacterium]